MVTGGEPNPPRRIANLPRRNSAQSHSVKQDEGVRWPKDNRL
jgi:hypothetical protein